MSRHGIRNPARIYSWPLVLAVVTFAALVAGLVGEGALDTAAVLGLALAPLLCLWKLFQAFSRSRS